MLLDRCNVRVGQDLDFLFLLLRIPSMLIEVILSGCTGGLAGLKKWLGCGAASGDTWLHSMLVASVTRASSCDVDWNGRLPVGDMYYSVPGGDSMMLWFLGNVVGVDKPTIGWLADSLDNMGCTSWIHGLGLTEMARVCRCAVKPY